MSKKYGHIRNREPDEADVWIRVFGNIKKDSQRLTPEQEKKRQETIAECQRDIANYEKAIKLAYICDVVFLLKHRYNMKMKLPNNVVPVSSWEEIYRLIRALLEKLNYKTNVRILFLAESLLIVFLLSLTWIRTQFFLIFVPKSF